MKQLTFLLFILLVCSGCQKYLMKTLGIEQITEFDQTKVDAFYETFDLSGLSVDKKVVGMGYYELLGQQEQFDSLEKKNLAQPIQFYTMDEEKVIHRMYNCLAPFGLKGLKWNHEGCYDSFPPDCSIDNYEDQFIFLNHQFLKEDVNRKYRVVFIWTNLLGLPSQKAFSTLLAGIDSSNTRADTHITFVNTDKIFSEVEMEIGDEK